MKDPATWLLYATRFDLAIALAGPEQSFD